MKTGRSPRRFSAPLAPTGGCAKLRQNRRHDPTHLPRRDRSLSSFPGVITRLPQGSCQAQLVHHDAHDQTPAFKLFWGTHMRLCPEQILFQVAIAMLMRKAPPVAAPDCHQGNTHRVLIEGDKPTFARIPFGAFGTLTLHTHHANLHVTGLSEMQPTPSTHGHHLPFLIVTHPDGFGSPHGLLARPLKEQPIQRRPSFHARAHGVPIQLAIAFEANEHLTAQFLTEAQKVCCRICDLSSFPSS
jgi:hypothetical protein